MDTATPTIIQPVFTQSDTTSPSPTIPEFPAVAVLLIAVLVAILPIVLVAKRPRQTKS